MAVIKSIEKLGQLKRMLRQVSRLGGRNALAHNVGGLGGSKPELPNFVAVGTIEILSKILGRDGACPVSGAVGDVAAIGDAASRVSTKCLWIKSTLAEDVRRPHDRVLYVRTGLSLETECIVEVKGDDRRFGVFQHEKTERADGNLRGDHGPLSFA